MFLHLISVSGDTLIHFCSKLIVYLVILVILFYKTDVLFTLECAILSIMYFELVLKIGMVILVYSLSTWEVGDQEFKVISNSRPALTT